MAIIYTYTQVTPQPLDSMVITDVDDNNYTKTAQIGAAVAASIAPGANIYFTSGGGITTINSADYTLGGAWVSDLQYDIILTENDNGVITNTGIQFEVETGVSATSSTGDPLILSTPGANRSLLASRAYAGGSNIGHVPPGGSTGHYLDGAIGAWLPLPADQDTTYTFDVPAATTDLTLTGSDASVSAVTITGGTDITVTRTSATELTIDSTAVDNDTTYDLTAAANGGTPANMDIILTGSDASVDTVTLVPGANITLADLGTNQLEITAATGGYSWIVSDTVGPTSYTVGNAEEIIFTGAGGVTVTGTDSGGGSAPYTFTIDGGGAGGCCNLQDTLDIGAVATNVGTGLYSQFQVVADDDSIAPNFITTLDLNPGTATELNYHNNTHTESSYLRLEDVGLPQLSLYTQKDANYTLQTVYGNGNVRTTLTDLVPASVSSSIVTWDKEGIMTFEGDSSNIAGDIHSEIRINGASGGYVDLSSSNVTTGDTAKIDIQSLGEIEITGTNIGTPAIGDLLGASSVGGLTKWWNLESSDGSITFAIDNTPTPGKIDLTVTAGGGGCTNSWTTVDNLDFGDSSVTASSGCDQSISFLSSDGSIAIAGDDTLKSINFSMAGTKKGNFDPVLVTQGAAGSSPMVVSPQIDTYIGRQAYYHVVNGQVYIDFWMHFTILPGQLVQNTLGVAVWNGLEPGSPVGLETLDGLATLNITTGNNAGIDITECYANDVFEQPNGGWEHAPQGGKLNKFYGTGGAPTQHSVAWLYWLQQPSIPGAINTNYSVLGGGETWVNTDPETASFVIAGSLNPILLPIL